MRKLFFKPLKLHFESSNLLVELSLPLTAIYVNIRLGSLATLKGGRKMLEELLFPLLDLSGEQLMLLAECSNGLLFFDGLECHLKFKIVAELAFGTF